jgi:3-hydroxybutyrate dehydrogenase
MIAGDIHSNVLVQAVFLCREEAKSITGTNLSMDGGWTAA